MPGPSKTLKAPNSFWTEAFGGNPAGRQVERIRIRERPISGAPVTPNGAALAITFAKQLARLLPHPGACPILIGTSHQQLGLAATVEQPGTRYVELAKRCRMSAARALTEDSRTALIKMAEGYECRAAKLRVSVKDLPRKEER